MSFNGSGTYTLPAGQPVVTGTVISSTTFNTLTSDLATALTNTICKDGQSTPTANIPMGGFKLTGLGAATAATDSARLSTVQNSQGQILGTIAGTNTITAQATPTLTAYASGQTFRFAAAGANTGATTLNIDSLGAKNIFWNGSACTGGEIGTGAFVTVTYDGTQFNLASSSAVGSNPFSDTNALVKNAADATKLVKFSAASVSASTTRTVTVPDKNGTMAMTSDIISTGVNGNARNLKMSVTAATATATVTADAVLVETSLGGSQLLLTSYSQSVNLATTGAGGMDTGTAPTSSFVSLYAIAKSDGTKNILACNVTTSTASIYAGANMPAGYTYSALIGIWPTNGSSQFPIGYQIDRKIYFSGVSILSGATAQTVYTSQSLSAGVPAAAKTADIMFASSTANRIGSIASDSAGNIAQYGAINTGGSILDTMGGFFGGIPMITAQTIWWKNTNADGAVITMKVSGYTF